MPRMSGAQVATGLAVAVAMLVIVTVCSLWWSRRATRARLVVSTLAGLLGAVGVWMLGVSVGAEPSDVENLGRGLLLLVVTVGSILHARRRLDAHAGA